MNSDSDPAKSLVRSRNAWLSDANNQRMQIDSCNSSIAKAKDLLAECESKAREYESAYHRLTGESMPPPNTNDLPFSAHR